MIKEELLNINIYYLTSVEDLPLIKVYLRLGFSVLLLYYKSSLQFYVLLKWNTNPKSIMSFLTNTDNLYISSNLNPPLVFRDSILRTLNDIPMWLIYVTDKDISTGFKVK